MSNPLRRPLTSATASAAGARAPRSWPSPWTEPSPSLRTVLRPSGTVPRSCSPGSRWPAALDSVVERLRDRGVYAKQLRVGCASHAPHVEPIADDLRAALADLRPGTTRIPLYSTVFERELDGQELDGDYWVHNLRQPVRFAPAVRMALDQRPHTLFIEISTHSVLVPAMLAGVASIGQVALGRTVPGRTALIGLLLLLAGLALLLVTLATGSAFVFFVGTAVWAPVGAARSSARSGCSPCSPTRPAAAN
jgi:hypothetical protein